MCKQVIIFSPSHIDITQWKYLCNDKNNTIGRTYLMTSIYLLSEPAPKWRCEFPNQSN